MLKKISYSQYLILALVAFLASSLFWLIFYKNIPGHLGFSNVSLETVFSNYDGPNYMVISKCGYNKTCIGSHFSLPQSLEYYPAHLPGFPLLIKYFSFFTTGPKAMLLATLLGSIFLTLISFEFFKSFLTARRAFWLSILLIFFPARLFVLRLVGAPETWFIGFILASILAFRNKHYFWAGVFAALAQIFKSPGVLLLVGYLVLAIYELIKGKKIAELFKKYISFILVPIVLVAAFYFYRIQAGDFWAYFHTGDNFHLNPLPYLVFIGNKSWINTFWLEDVLYIYLFGLYGAYFFFKKYKFNIISLFTGIFVLATLFVAHRDISRYIAPVYPFLFLAFQKFLNKKSVKIIFLILLPAIILFAINFVAGNTAPISDWTPYL